jgi:RNA polymerase sigma factor (sigma-70 family)
MRHDVKQDLVLGLEMVIEPTLRQLQGSRYIVHGRGIVTLLLKQAGGSAKDFLTRFDGSLAWHPKHGIAEGGVGSTSRSKTSRTKEPTNLKLSFNGETNSAFRTVISLKNRERHLPTHDQVAEVEELYWEHGSALLLFGTAITGERSRAQDAVHEVFVKLLDSAHLSNVRDRKAYLFVSVRNAILNDSRIRQRNVAFEGDAGWFIPPERDYAAEGNLRGALEALPDDQRQVVVLHVWGELTFAQIAEVLEISSSTAASRYRYALAKLREVMCNRENSRANSR